MKKSRIGRAFICVLFACAFLLIVIQPASSVLVSHARIETEEDGVFTLEPSLSDGIAITLPETGSLSIHGHEDEGSFVFEESKTLRFTAVFSEGWSFSEGYSVFFPGDSRASAAANADGSVDFAFEAAAGESVELEALNSVRINAACQELPKLYINASVPFDQIDRQTWVDASFTLELGTKQFESGNFEGTGSVKGRGNSSWSYPKKPYSIKLSKKESLLDIPKTKKYAVIPSYNDGSLMRNFITYKAYQSLLGIDYVPKCEFVDVYLNGEYNGIYILVERIDIEKSKVDIEEANENDLTGGYLIEKNCYGKFSMNNDIWFNCPYWANQVRDYFELHAPEPEGELRTAMLEYLESWVNAIHDCIIGENGEDYTRYVDVSSWVDFIILQEIAKNPDGNFKTSCWFYKQSGDDKLYFTAPWDFDFAYGLVNWSNASEGHNDVVDCPTCDTPEDFMIINSSAPWIDRLYDTKSEFSLALKARYTYYRHTIVEELFRLIDEQAAYLSIVQQPNFDLWHKNFTTGVNRLRTWLTNRIAWLDSVWLIEDGGIELDPALNLYGKTLHFETDGEENAFIGASRNGEAVGIAEGEAEYGVRLSAELMKGEFVSFDCAATGENAVLTLYVNGEPALTHNGDMTNLYYTVDENGTYEFRWCFTGGGSCILDNVGIDLGYTIGDVNMDGRVNISDALLVLRHAMGILDLGSGARLADIDANGNISVSDAVILMRRVMNIL